MDAVNPVETFKEQMARIVAGAIVLPRVSIGPDTIVGAGAVVTQNLPAGVIAYGNPARIHRDRRAGE
jgi:maltose O-acetyltransferase